MVNPLWRSLNLPPRLCALGGENRGAATQPLHLLDLRGKTFVGQPHPPPCLRALCGNPRGGATSYLRVSVPLAVKIVA